MILYWLSCVLLLVGLLVLLDFNPLRYIPDSKTIKTWFRQIVAAIQEKRHISLKTKVYKILGRRKDNIFVRTMGEALDTLERTGERSKAKQMERSCYFFSAAGVCIGLILGNYFLVPALGIGLYFIPLWFIKLSYNAYIAHVNGELDIALSQITSGYVSSNNLVIAVKENIQYLKPPVREAFEKFVFTVENVDPNVERAILQMQSAFDSYIFHEWCNALVQCQSDSTLKSTLRPHVEKFSHQKLMQEKQRTGQMKPLQEFIGISLITPSTMLMLYLFQPDWFSGLLTNPVGQLAIAITAAVMIIGLNKAITIATPYQMRR